MKKIMIFMLLGLAVLSGRAYGDNGELNFSSNNPQNSLIADCPDLLVSVLYEDLGARGYFYIRAYHDTTNSIKFDAPYPCRIKDMEYYGTYLYFCGDSPTGGIVGFFDVNQAINSGHVDYSICYIPSHPTLKTDITSANKLALFEYTHGQQTYIHVAFVGDMSLDNVPVGTTVGDAYFDGSLWTVEFDYNKGWEYDYKDITTTESLVVSVGLYKETDQYFLKVWRKGTSFLLTVIPNNYATIPVNGTILDHLLITRMNGDTLAVAYPYFKNPKYYIKMDVLEYSGQVNLVSSFRLGTTINPPLYSLSYDSVYKNIMFSFRMRLPQPSEPTLYMLGSVWNYLSPTSINIYHYLDNGPYHCVCGDGLGGYQSSGIYIDANNNPVFDMFYLSGIYINNCAWEGSLGVEYIDLSVNNSDRGTVRDKVTTTDKVMLVTHQQSPLDPHCYNHH